MSILHSPEDHYRQSSIIKPVRLYQFITSLKEDARISYLASLRIVEDQWKESRKAHPLLEYEGMHVFQKDRYRGLMDLNDLQGLPWMNEKNGSGAALSLSRELIGRCVGHGETGGADHAFSSTRRLF